MTTLMPPIIKLKIIAAANADVIAIVLSIMLVIWGQVLVFKVVPGIL